MSGLGRFLQRWLADARAQLQVAMNPLYHIAKWMSGLYPSVKNDNLFMERHMPNMSNMKENILNFLTDERDPHSLRAISSSIATVATIIGAFFFFYETACEQNPKIPWMGIFLLVGGLAAIFTEIALFAERAAHGDKIGTWVVKITLLIIGGCALIGFLFLFGVSCPTA